MCFSVSSQGWCAKIAFISRMLCSFSGALAMDSIQEGSPPLSEGRKRCIE
jgi:hypothetical protein